MRESVCVIVLCAMAYKEQQWIRKPIKRSTRAMDFNEIYSMANKLVPLRHFQVTWAIATHSSHRLSSYIARTSTLLNFHLAVLAQVLINPYCLWRNLISNLRGINFCECWGKTWFIDRRINWPKHLDYYWIGSSHTIVWHSK